MKLNRQSGSLDVFAFIGTSKAADDLQKAHPKPHRLRICLGNLLFYYFIILLFILLIYI